MSMVLYLDIQRRRQKLLFSLDKTYWTCYIE